MGEVFDVVVQKLREGLGAGSGGNTLIASGTGSGAPAGDIIFNVGNLEVLRIDPDGKFFYKGEKLVDNADVALVLRGWLGYCLVVMNRESRVRFEGEARIAELEAKLRAAEKELDARVTDSDLADVFANSQAKSKELDGWRDWAQQVIGVALVDAAASRFRIDKKIVDLESKLEVVTEQRDDLWKANEKRAAALAELEAQLKVVTEQRDARVKDGDVPEFFEYRRELLSHEHWLKESRSILKDWREWAASCIDQTYAGEADSWLRVRVSNLITALRPPGIDSVTPLTVEEILFVRDAFQAAKRSSPYGLSP
jgi:hypothetical protein